MARQFEHTPWEAKSLVARLGASWLAPLTAIALLPWLAAEVYAWTVPDAGPFLRGLLNLAAMTAPFLSLYLLLMRYRYQGGDLDAYDLRVIAQIASARPEVGAVLRPYTAEGLRLRKSDQTAVERYHLSKGGRFYEPDERRVIDNL